MPGSDGKGASRSAKQGWPAGEARAISTAEANQARKRSMFDELQGRAVRVTGPSTGIGAAVAKGFARLGAQVAVHYNKSAAEAEAVAAEIRAAGGKAVLLHGDVSDSAVARRMVDEAAERCGRLDILVNNAGGMVERRLIADADDAVLDRVLDLNVRSVIAATAAP